MEMFVGEWRYEGAGQDCPFGAAGKFKGTESAKFILSGFFVESRWKDVDDSGFVAEGVVMHWYDPASKVYRDAGFDLDGVASSTSTTVDGNIWTSLGTRADKTGKIYQTKFVSTFSEDGRTVKSTAEYSEDGKNWKPWWELTSKKRK